jgi:hypothetical protein
MMAPPQDQTRRPVLTPGRPSRRSNEEMMGEHQIRARRERQIAEEIAHEIQRRVLGPTMRPEDLVGQNETVCGVFADFFDRHQVVSEESGARILAHVPKVLAKLNFEFAERNRRLDAATRQGKTP